MQLVGQYRFLGRKTAPASGNASCSLDRRVDKGVFWREADWSDAVGDLDFLFELDDGDVVVVINRFVELEDFEDGNF